MLAFLLPCPVLAEPPERDETPDNEFRLDEEAPEDEARVDYDVAIVGVEEPDLEKLLTQISQLSELQSKPPASLAGLRRRAEGDLERFRKALRSEGFYASKLDLRIATADAPVAVTVEVQPGTIYLLEDYEIVYQGAPNPGEALPQRLEDLDLELGMPARAPDIVAAEQRLLKALREGGHPLARILDREAVVDHALGALTVTLTVDAGPAAAFGAVSFEGLDGVEEDYLQDILPWSVDEPWDQRKVEEARLLLARTALFESIVIEPAERVDEAGRLAMIINVIEADHRSIGGGLSFSTDLGPGANVFWEHRNLLGRNESLRLAAQASTEERRAEATLRKPRFWRADQSLLSSLTLVDRENDAFDEQSVRAFGGLERSIATIWTVSGGVGAEFARLEDEEGKDSFLIYDLPLGVVRDARDDFLNPTEGTRVALTVTPAFGTIEDNVFFVTSDLSASGYLSLDEEDRVILAARGRFGSILGEESAVLPANRRLYSGGGGSVRGYEFQTIGPLDADDDPLGGRSVIEVGAEVRVRITEEIGVVPFIEGGIVGDDPMPDFDEDFLWAAGLGLRYFTEIGPLRLDVAVPINRRDRDDRFQFYVSLGQAF